MKKDNEIETKEVKKTSAKENKQVKADTEITPVKKEKAPKAPKKEKAPKEEKTIPAKKLPGILKKNYTRKKLQGFLKHIYVESDKTLVESFFVPNPAKEGKFYIPKDQLLPKSQFNKLKTIGKDVASQKFSLKIVPLAATIAVFVVAGTVVTAFKNQITKKILINTMQSTFKAKTFIKSVNVEIFGSSISIKGVEQGYAADPMKNLFELDEVTIDFNLTELLRGKFDLENIAVEGVNVMTPRETSAALPEVIKSKEKSVFQETLENKAQIAQDAAKEELDKLFEQYNPENMLKNLEAQLQSPTVAKEVYLTGEGLVKKWQAKPEELTKKVNDFSSKVNSVADKDWSKVDNPVEIKKAIEQITSVINEGKSLAEESTKIVNEVKVDSNTIKEASIKVTDALKADTDFVDSEIKKIKSFSINDGVRLLSGPIDTILYKTIGKYYPYIKQGIGLAMQTKAASSGNAEKKEKEVKPSSDRKRLPGIDVYYKKDRVPKFLVERMSVSGVNWSGLATDISSDMDKRGLPAVAQVKMDISGQHHSGDVTVDARTSTKNPLVQLNYEGTNYPIAFKVPEFGLSSNSVIKGHGAVESNGTVTVDAVLAMKKLAFETEKFEPEFAYNLYTRALNHLKEMSIGIELKAYRDESFDIKISSDADKQLANVLKKLVNEELETLKQNAKVQITKLLDEQTGGATSKIKEFINIENGINSESVKFNNLNKTLEKKKKELEDKLKSEMNSQLKANGAGETVEVLNKLKLF